MLPLKTSSQDREERILRKNVIKLGMENQLMESVYQKQQYPKKYDYTHTKNPFAVPVNQLDYKSFYQSFQPSNTNQLFEKQVYTTKQPSSFSLNNPNEKISKVNKKQQQQQYRDILQQQVEDRKTQNSKINSKIEYADIFTKQHSPNKINNLTKQEYAGYLQLQVEEKMSRPDNKKVHDSPNQNLNKTAATSTQKIPDREKKESKEFRMIQMQLKQYQEENKQQQDRKLLLQKKFEESESFHEKVKEKSVSPGNHGRKQIQSEYNQQEKQRSYEQKNLVQQFLTEQINEKQRRREEEKKQQETEAKMVEEKLKNDLEKLMEEKKFEEEQRKEKQGKIQEENIKMHQLKLKQKYQRSKSNTFLQNDFAEMEEVIENLEQEVQEEKEQEQKDEIIQTQQQQEQGLPYQKIFTFEDQQNMELEKLKFSMLEQQKELERSIHQAMNQAQIGLLEGKNRLEKEIVLQKNKNNKAFNEDYAISLLNNQSNKYKYELPSIFQPNINFNIHKNFENQSLISQTNMIPINEQLQQRSYLQGQEEKKSSRSRSKGPIQQNYYTQLLEIKKNPQEDNLSKLLMAYNQ